MNYDELQSKTIDLIRFPISMGVVFIHNSYGGAVVDMQSLDWTALSGSNLFDIFRLLTKNLATIATPFFFIVSGYYYFRKTEVLNKEAYISKTLNRTKTLLIPYIIWNILAFLVPMLTALAKGDLPAYMAKFEGVNPLSIFWNYKYYTLSVPNLLGFKVYEAMPLNVPLWFLRDLFLMSLLSPVIYYFIKKTRIYGVLALGLCYLTTTWTSVTGFKIISVFFFTLGAYFGINKLNIVVEARKYKYLILLICLLSIILDTYLNGLAVQLLFIRPLYRIAGLISFIIVGSYVVERNWLSVNVDKRLIAKSSFFIYVAHTVSILGVIVKIYSHFFHPETPFGQGVVYVSISVTTILVCLAIYFSLRKLFPRFLNVMTGDR